MKTIINGVFLALFIIAFSLFVLYIKYFVFRNSYIEAIRTGMILELVLQILAFEWWGMENDLQRSFRSVSIICLIFCLVIVILTKLCILSSPYNILITFYSSVSATTLAILYSAKRHGYFKD